MKKSKVKPKKVLKVECMDAATDAQFLDTKKVKSATETLKEEDYIVVIPKNYKKVHIKGPILNKWLKALRSGKYQQTSEGVLRMGDSKSYCCLGVLCKVQGVLSRLKDNDADKSFYDMSESLDGSTSTAQDAGALSQYNALFSVLGFQGSFSCNSEGADVCVLYWPPGKDDFTIYRDLASLNDAGMTFEQIAEVIDTVWKA